MVRAGLRHLPRDLYVLIHSDGTRGCDIRVAERHQAGCHGEDDDDQLEQRNTGACAFAHGRHGVTVGKAVMGFTVIVDVGLPEAETA